jgi:hypothetical protein
MSETQTILIKVEKRYLALIERIGIKRSFFFNQLLAKEFDNPAVEAPKRKERAKKPKAADLPADTVEATVIPRINFDTAWNAYPKKLGRKEAERHFNASVKTEKDFDDLMQAIKNYSEYVAGKEEQYIKMGSTFFNNWRDWIKGSVLIDSAEAIQDKIQKAMELTNNQPRGNYGGLFDSR